MIPVNTFASRRAQSQPQVGSYHSLIDDPEMLCLL
jgi:hypothetical protein